MNKGVFFAAALAAILWPLLGNSATATAVATLSYLGQSGLPRGMRNNNPGNITRGATAWKGKVPHAQSTDNAFEQFETYPYGIRAMIKNIMSYNRDRGIDTLRGVISTWAPSTENDTAAYIRFVEARTGIRGDAKMNFDQTTLRAVVIAMAAMENGREAITPAQFNYAYSLI